MRLFGEFYASDRAWECSRDKLEFKKECIRAGLTVPKCYNLSGFPMDVEQDGLVFPLVVKPADSFASLGVSICNNPEELKKGIDFARKTSPKNKIVVEEYIDGDEITFKEFAETVWQPNWLERNTKITDRVKEDYLRILNSRIVPAIGRLKLNKIRATEIDKILHEMTDSGKAAKTVRYTFTVVNSVMKYAFKKQYIKENPCDRCDDLPSVKRDNNLHYFTMEQGMTFLAALDNDYMITAPAHNRIQESGEYSVSSYSYLRTGGSAAASKAMWKAYFYLAFFGGFRRGEMCALTWEDIDFDNQTIRINKAAARTKRDGQIVKNPKTETSVRDITLPQQCMDVLHQWKTEERLLMMRFGSAWEGHREDFDKQNVFIQLQNGKPIKVDSPTHKFRSILDHYNASCEDKSQQLPIIRLHDLRHTMITMLINNGMDIETLSKRAGHSKPSITMDVYGHALKIKDRKAANILEDMFFAQG